VIKRYAGPVTYDASNFLEKNNDSLFGNMSQIKNKGAAFIYSVVQHIEKE